MANPFDAVRLPLAIGRKNKFRMNPKTTLTQDWFSLRPVFSTELMPHSDLSVSQSYYVRMSPLAKPMMGSGRVVNRAFFVPYRTIMPGFDDFISDVSTPNNGNNVRFQHVPYCKQSMLCDALVDFGGTTEASEAAYDFIYYTNGTLGYKNFNEKGRNMYAVLTGLGYSLSFGFQSTDEPVNVDVSLMKLLAYFKIVQDWYVSNNFRERADSIRLIIDTIGRTLTVTAAQLQQLFSLGCYSTLDNDYFSTASVNPVTPVGSTGVTITDVTNDASAGTQYSSVKANGEADVTAPTTPYVSGTSNSSGTYYPVRMTQYIVNALSALTSYMQRNNIVGYKTLDRFKARFGVELSADKLDRSYYLGSNSSYLSVAEVMSNADTDGASLGDYCGRGETGNQAKKFHYKNDSNSFGVFIILSTILPEVHYGQGISRDNLHINRFDFFTPEFDALGMQAVARAELWNDAKTLPLLTNLRQQFQPNLSFGLQPTYSEYCKINDILAGDFRRINTLDLRGFHLYRMFGEPLVEGSPLPSDYKQISESFVVGNPSEYNKIFNYKANDYDHFYCVHSFDVTLVQPKKRLFDSYEFHDDNEGAPVTMPYKGTKLN